MLELRKLSKTYGGQQVLAGLDWIFRPGEFVAIMGESGVGKSTLLNLIDRHTHRHHQLGIKESDLPAIVQNVQINEGVWHSRYVTR